MRRENWFVIILVALCMGLATMAAVSSSPSNDEKSGFEGFDSRDEATVTEGMEVLDSV